MIRKHQLYRHVTAAGMLLSVVAVIAAYSGNAAPIVSASQLPGDRWFAFGLVVALVIVGATVIGIISARAWKAMGRRIGLTPESAGGLVAKPDLTGEVDGRPVRARTVERKVSSGDQGKTKKTCTVVEADLTEPVTEGIMIGRSGPDEEPVTTDSGSAEVGGQVIDDRFVVVGNGSEDLARSLLSNRARNALLDLEDCNYLSVGDPTDSIIAAVPDLSGSFLDSAFESKMERMLEKEIAGEITTAAILTKTVVLDPERIERQVEAVVAVADAHEEALVEAARA